MLQVNPQQMFAPDEYYAWFVEANQFKLLLGAYAMVAVVLAAVMFPLWPISMRIGVWYLSMAVLGLVGLFFGIAIFRLIFWVITIVVAKPGIWIFPNLFADVGFVSRARSCAGNEELMGSCRWIPSFRAGVGTFRRRRRRAAHRRRRRRRGRRHQRAQGRARDLESSSWARGRSSAVVNGGVRLPRMRVIGGEMGKGADRSASSSSHSERSWSYNTAFHASLLHPTPYVYALRSPTNPCTRPLTSSFPIRSLTSPSSGKLNLNASFALR